MMVKSVGTVALCRPALPEFSMCRADSHPRCAALPAQGAEGGVGHTSAVAGQQAWVCAGRPARCWAEEGRRPLDEIVRRRWPAWPAKRRVGASAGMAMPSLRRE